MWLPGHLSVSFLLCLPLLVQLRRQRLLAIYYVGLFALLPDFIHLGPLRMYSHSILGIAIMLIITLGALFISFRPNPLLLVSGAVAAYGHLLADLYIGSIYPFHPFSEEWFQLHQFNSLFNIRVEIVLSSIALVILALAFGFSRLYRSRRELTRSERINLLLILLPFLVMVMLQGAYYLFMMMQNPWDPLRTVLLLFFLIPLVFSAALLIGEPSLHGY